MEALLDCIISVPPHVKWSESNGEILFFDEEREQIFGLDYVGPMRSCVWLEESLWPRSSTTYCASMPSSAASLSGILPNYLMAFVTGVSFGSSGHLGNERSKMIV
jgi:hypothetical protein